MANYKKNSLVKEKLWKLLYHNGDDKVVQEFTELFGASWAFRITSFGHWVWYYETFPFGAGAIA